MSTNERLIVFITASAHFFTHFSMLAFPAMVMPMSRDLGLPISQIMDLSFWMYFLYGVLALGWGWISDKWGHKTALGAGLLVSGAGLILAGLTPSLLVLPYSFALVGAGCSAYHPAGTALVSQGVRERGRALGIIGMWGNVGMALVPFLIGLFNVLIGWRGGLIVVGVVAIMLGISSWFARYTVQKEGDEMKVEALDERTAKRLMIIFMGALVFGGLLFRSFTLSLPAFLETRLGDIQAMTKEALGAEGAGGATEGG
ncbi:MAG: MFS transporter, partial [Spirochaetaceae bacterium]